MGFIYSVYRNEESKLYYRFLEEIIEADIAVQKDSLVLSSFLDEKNHSMLSDEVIDEFLFSIYERSHKNDIVGGNLPQTNKYPPTNKKMMEVPPTPLIGVGMRHAQLLYIGQHSQAHVATSIVSPLDDDEIIVIRFVTGLAPDDDISVIIGGILNNNPKV